MVIGKNRKSFDLQLLLNYDEQATLKKVLKYIQRLKENKNLKISAKDEISGAELGNLYDVFVDKLENSVYAKRLKLQGDTLMEKRDSFVTLSLEDKCILLSEILHLFQCQSTAANLKLIGGPASAGILVMSNVIDKCQQICIINQSPTGIYEQEIDLLAL